MEQGQAAGTRIEQRVVATAEPTAHNSKGRRDSDCVFCGLVRAVVVGYGPATRGLHLLFSFGHA